MAEPRGPTTYTVIIPTLNEASIIERTLRITRERVPEAELIVVDGQSTDDTIARARPLARVISTRRGRGIQLNAGARAASGDVLLFPHADTILGPDCVQRMLDALEDPEVLGGAWRLRFDDPRPAYRALARMVTKSALVTHTFTGAQALFVRRTVFLALGGFRPWPLMEDLEFSARLARYGPTVLLDAEVETSARRLRSWGLARTQATAMLVGALYAARVPPHRFARLWPPVRE
jgi:rSAM/selenodomain-associated transferase 2